MKSQVSKQFCKHSDNCSGCQLLDRTYEEQKLLKTKELESLLATQGLGDLPRPAFASVAEHGLRDRLDFILQDGRLGLFSKADRRLIWDIDHCLQLSPRLGQWLSEFRNLDLPKDLQGSLRLRVGPEGTKAPGLKGVWLDFSNLDVKKLLVDGQFLNHLLKLSVVEIGQRRKRLVLNSTELKLSEPKFEVWSRTWTHERLPMDLYSCVGSFTQVGDAANRLIVSKVLELAKLTKARRVLELGAGCGNLSLALASSGFAVRAVENDNLSLQALQKNINCYKEKLEEVSLVSADFQVSHFAASLEDQFDLLLVNPPRSGLGPNFFKKKVQLPRAIIYMSCFPESFARDLAALKAWGYQMVHLEILDQFPQTKHFETLALLSK